MTDGIYRGDLDWPSYFGDKGLGSDEGCEFNWQCHDCPNDEVCPYKIQEDE